MTASPSISIMTAPAAGTSVNSAPTILMEDGGLWRELAPVATELNLEEVRENLDEALRLAVTNIDKMDAIEGLRLPATTLFRTLIPPDLAKTLSDARGADEPPTLRIHVRPEYEWIPWETLRDAHGFLGLDFQIARLPILQRAARAGKAASHGVSRIVSVLGRRVVNEDNGEYDVWRRTFADLVPDDALSWLPPTVAEKNWPQNAALDVEADILHITCHGETNEKTGTYWTLDPERAFLGPMYHVKASNVVALTDAFAATRPLVFGNACTPENVAAAPEHCVEPPPLASAFFRSGALNFVGTVAPIRKATALKFARAFYEELLGNGLPIGQALHATKARCRSDPELAPDPTSMFYCLYGPPETVYSPGDGGG